MVYPSVELPQLVEKFVISLTQFNLIALTPTNKSWLLEFLSCPPLGPCLHSTAALLLRTGTRHLFRNHLFTILQFRKWSLVHRCRRHTQSDKHLPHDCSWCIASSKYFMVKYICRKRTLTSCADSTINTNPFLKSRETVHLYFILSQQKQNKYFPGSLYALLMSKFIYASLMSKIIYI